MTRYEANRRARKLNREAPDSIEFFVRYSTTDKNYVVLRRNRDKTESIVDY